MRIEGLTDAEREFWREYVALCLRHGLEIASDCEEIQLFRCDPEKGPTCPAVSHVDRQHNPFKVWEPGRAIEEECSAIVREVIDSCDCGNNPVSVSVTPIQ